MVRQMYNDLLILSEPSACRVWMDANEIGMECDSPIVYSTHRPLRSSINTRAERPVLHVPALAFHGHHGHQRVRRRAAGRYQRSFSSALQLRLRLLVAVWLVRVASGHSCTLAATSSSAP